MTRIVVASDSHFSERAPEASANWAAVVDYVAATSPDLVVHAGDLAVDAPTDPSELALARSRLDQLAVPWRAVPGNHDIGDNVGGADGDPVNATTLAAWRDVVGADTFRYDVDGWTILGVNAEIFDAGSVAEDEQWAWLEESLPDDRPLVLVTHKPLTADADELAAAPPSRFVPAKARDRLMQLIGGRELPLVVSGHVHQFRVLDRGRTHAWAPTSWAVIPEDIQATIGEKRCGILDIELGHDGHVAVAMVEPPGLAQFTLRTDIPSPYDH